jgi:hypothetical protein
MCCDNGRFRFMSVITDLMDRMITGTMTVDEVAEQFRTYTWPAVRPAPANADESWARMLEDPETPPEGSFFDVSVYFSQRKITGEQYDVLARAAAEGMKRGADQS